jgi:hypothetical protein
LVFTPERFDQALAVVLGASTILPRAERFGDTPNAEAGTGREPRGSAHQTAASRAKALV